MLRVGDTAPDFEVTGGEGRRRTVFRLSALRGEKYVLLAFYPLDWMPT